MSPDQIVSDKMAADTERKFLYIVRNLPWMNISRQELYNFCSFKHYWNGQIRKLRRAEQGISKRQINAYKILRGNSENKVDVSGMYCD
jgi:hypothetical protein